MPYVDKVKSVKKTTGVSQPRWAIWCEIWKFTCLPSLYTVSVGKLWTQNTRIIHDVWRLLILSNEEKRMIMNILKKEWFIWKFWKKGGSREKGGGGNEIHVPCACDPVGGIMSYLRYLCLFTYNGVQHIFCCVFWFCFVCLRLVSCVWWCPTYIVLWFFFAFLSSSCVLCTQCCQFFWIVNSWLPLRFL